MKMLSKVKSYLKRNQEDKSEQNESDEDQEVTMGTKVKVIAALLVVGFATYIAYWVQEPSQIKVDVLDSDIEAEEMTADEIDAAIKAEGEVALNDESINSSELEISIVDFTYSPANITIDQGTKVVWTNVDTVAHTVSSDFFTSDSMEPGNTFSYTFNDEGEFEYYSSYYPQMSGKVTVLSSGAAETPVEDLSAAAVEEDTEEIADSESADEATSLDLLMVDVEDEEFLSLDDTSDNESMREESESVEEESDDDTVMLSDESSTRAAAVEDEDQELSNTGPEDLIYGLLFIAILFFNRKKILSGVK